MKFIALDIGSSFIKSAVLDLEHRRLLDATKEPAPPMLPAREPRYFEVSAEAIADCILQRIEQHVEQHPDIIGIVLSTQMHGFLLTDSLGQAITPYISWQDQRCLGAVEGEASSSGVALSSFERLSNLVSKLQATSGIRLTPRHAICNLYHYLGSEGRVVRPMQGIRFQTLGSYINQRLTGEHATHLTNAAATGCADVVHGQWNEPLIEAAGCSFLKFPDIRQETEAVGIYSGSYGPIAVYPDIGDHQATVLGCFASAKTDAVITLGTAGIISCIDGNWSESGGSYEVRPFFEGQFLNTVTQLPGGRNLDVLIRFVQSIAAELLGMSVSEERIWQEVQSQMDIFGNAALTPAQAPASIPASNVGSAPASSVAPTSASNVGPASGSNGSRTGSGLQLEMGFFQGQRGVDKGMITGIDGDNLRAGPLFAAAFDNLADVYNRMLNVLCGDPHELHNIVFSGGLAYQNKALRERLTEKIGLASSMSPLPDESLTGLFRLALVCSGICRNLDETECYLWEESVDSGRSLRLMLG
jgi:sugar (pentulose or hexulose) kinase